MTIEKTDEAKANAEFWLGVAWTAKEWMDEIGVAGFGNNMSQRKGAWQHALHRHGLDRAISHPSGITARQMFIDGDLDFVYDEDDEAFVCVGYEQLVSSDTMSE